jgi:DHA1 family tetracycline resistance protein-like MFS transporter
MSTAFSVGFLGGPAVGGLLASHDWYVAGLTIAGLRAPFVLAAALCAVNWIYGLLVLPESLPRDKRAGFSWRRANPIGSLALLRGYPQLLGLSAVNFLHYLAHAVLPSVFVLYAGYRYGWDEQTVGLTLGAVGVFSAIVQGGLIRPIVARVGERTALLIGLACGALGFVIYGVAPTGALFCVGLPIMALWGLTNPAAQALMTARAEQPPGDRQHDRPRPVQRPVRAVDRARPRLARARRRVRDRGPAAPGRDGGRRPRDAVTSLSHREREMRVRSTGC